MVIGGTGRFDGATGAGVADGIASFEPGAVSVIRISGTGSATGELPHRVAVRCNLPKIVIGSHIMRPDTYNRVLRGK